MSHIPVTDTIAHALMQLVDDKTRGKSRFAALVQRMGLKNVNAHVSRSR